MIQSLFKCLLKIQCDSQYSKRSRYNTETIKTSKFEFKIYSRTIFKFKIWQQNELQKFKRIGSSDFLPLSNTLGTYRNLDEFSFQHTGWSRNKNSKKRFKFVFVLIWGRLLHIFYFVPLHLKRKWNFKIFGEVKKIILQKSPLSIPLRIFNPSFISYENTTILYANYTSILDYFSNRNNRIKFLKNSSWSLLEIEFLTRFNNFFLVWYTQNYKICFWKS